MSRRELERRYHELAEVSPALGALDEQALERVLEENPDRGVSLLGNLARATDRELRQKARLLAARLLVPLTRQADPSRYSGAVRLVTSRREGVDLDMDAVVDEVAGRGTEQVPADELRWHRWERPSRAYVLVVDASDSVSGTPLATAVVTAAALAARCAPGDGLAVIAFWSRAVVLRPIASPAPPMAVLDALFDLRGGDMTDLATGLRTALEQAGRAVQQRRDILLLTDGLATAGEDPVPGAATAPASGAAVHVLALRDEPEHLDACRRIADAGGGRLALLRSVADAPSALADVLG